jgi:membrane-associated phospholipid phosphatase
MRALDNMKLRKRATGQGQSNEAGHPSRVLLVIGASAIILAHVLDGWMYRNFRLGDIYSHDWGRLLRVLGFLPLWFTAALALWLQERIPKRALMLAFTPALAGLVGEILKLLLRRERPASHEGAYYFRPFDERTFSSGGLALPSSHAIVAFGAAAILSRLFPRAWIVWWALAWGCGLSRVAAGAHFLSDVVVAALAAWLVAARVWRWQAVDAVPLTDSDPRARHPTSVEPAARRRRSPAGGSGMV